MSKSEKDKIYVDEFLRLTNATLANDGAYHISESGVRANLNLDDTERAKLSTEEAAAISQFEREAVLSFPTDRILLAKWVEDTGGDFRLPDGFEAPQAAEPKPDLTTPNYKNPDRWEYTARQIGEAWMLEQRRLREKRDWPGLVEIAKHVARELRSRRIIGAHGKAPHWQTVKRHALAGLTGAKPKGQG